MSGTAVARRYAQALLLTQGGADPAVRTAFKEIIDLYRSVGELREALSNPRVSIDEKSRVLGRLSPSAPAVLEKFFRLVLERRRGGEIERIYEEYCRIADLGSGEAEAVVETVVPLSEAEQQRMLSALERRFGQRLRLTLRIDPSLMGGVRVLVGDRLLDDTIAARLRRARRQLITQSEVGGQA